MKSTSEDGDHKCICATTGIVIQVAWLLFTVYLIVQLAEKAWLITQIERTLEQLLSTGEWCLLLDSEVRKAIPLALLRALNVRLDADRGDTRHVWICKP